MEALVSMFFSLATSAQNGTLVCMFSAIKQNALSNIEVYKAIVLVAVSLILVFKVVKLSYVIMSDEQHAGFGGVRLWDILRPLVIVLIIQSCSVFVNLFDSAVETVTFSIYRSVENMATATKTSTGKVIEKFEINGKEFDLTRDGNGFISRAIGSSGAAQAAKEAVKDLKKMAEEAAKEKQKLLESTRETEYYTASDGSLIKLENAVNSDRLSVEDQERLAQLNADINAPKEMEKTITEALGEYVDCAEEITNPRSSVLAAVTWVYDRMVVVVICVSDIVLCCLIMFLPLVLALSIFDVWKKNVWSWVGTYVEVSLWKVTGAVINWFVINARSASLKVCMSSQLKAVSAAINGTQSDYAQSGTAMLVFIGVAVAGVIALFKVPSITNAVLALGKPIGDLGLIASTIKSPASAAGGAVKMGKTLS